MALENNDGASINSETVQILMAKQYNEKLSGVHQHM